MVKQGRKSNCKFSIIRNVKDILTHFKAVIFDMDGTLVHNMHFHQEAWMKFLLNHGIHVSQEEYDKKNHGIRTEIVPRYFDRQLSMEEIEQLGEEKEALYRQLYAPHLTAIKGLLSFLQELKENNIRIALATAGDRKNIDFTIDGLGIRDYFDVIIGSEEVKKGKPDPEVFLISAEQLGINPSACLVAEDSESGIQAGLAAGMQVLGIASTHTKEQLSRFPLYACITDYTELQTCEV